MTRAMRYSTRGGGDDDATARLMLLYLLR